MEDVRDRVINRKRISGLCDSSFSIGGNHTHARGEDVDESRLVVFDLNVLYKIMEGKTMNIW
jgi:hypothetical protein